ncbi:helix-turn-helix domain-containing protein [Microbacterium resistens]
MKDARETPRGRIRNTEERVLSGDTSETLRCRQAHGYTSQEAFAHHVDLDRTYISGLERGVRNPTLDVIVKLARALDVKPSEMLETIDV